MQYLRHHPTDALRPAATLSRLNDSTLILVRADTEQDEEMIEHARLALRTSSPGASLLQMGNNHPKYGQGHPNGYIPIRVIHQPQICSRLLTFPPHESLGHVALQLLSQGVPTRALNTVPIKRQHRFYISRHDLLLVLPHETEAEHLTPYQH